MDRAAASTVSNNRTHVGTAHPMIPTLLLVMSVTNGIKFPIGPDRISKWMFSVMQKAGVTAKYTSGSARMASASRLLDNGQNSDYVIGLGRWTSNSIFNRHYNRSRLANMGILGITV